MPKVAVIGTTSWGTTLAIALAQKGLTSCLWARSEDEAGTLRVQGEHRARLPGVFFPPSLQVTSSLDEALDQCDMVVLAVPSQSLRENARQLARRLGGNAIVASAAKGLELHSSLRMSEVLAGELPAARDRICVISGPNLSREIAAGMPAATVVAAQDPAVADEARDLFRTPRLRVYCSRDVAGVELGGALKNIIALGAGMNDGWGYGANSKAAFMTRGLAEITRLGVAAGADPLTFLGLAGLGDLVATCTSAHSRNRRAGELLARGRTVDGVQAELGGVAEGITTTPAACALSHRLHVEMPITEMTYGVLYQGVDPRKAIFDLMSREPKYELEGLGNS